MSGRSQRQRPRRYWALSQRRFIALWKETGRLQTQFQMGLLYLLDANVLIDAKRNFLQFERVPQFWSWLLHMGVEGRVKVPQEVYEKITDDKCDDLAIWLKTNKSTMLLVEEASPELVEFVLERGYGEGLTDAENRKLNEDPFLIAYALADVDHRCVVTSEVSRPTATRANRKIPDVCNDLQVCCLNTVQLIEELDFRTDWNTL